MSKDKISSGTPRKEAKDEVATITIVVTALNYAVLVFFAYMRELFRYLFSPKDNNPTGYAPLVKSFEGIYIRRIYARGCDCFSRPISSAPSTWMEVLDQAVNPRTKSVVPTGKTVKCLNLGSYNYLGFSDVEPMLGELLDTIDQYGVSMCSTAVELGTSALHKRLETVVSQYVGKEDALIFGMGFATNSTVIPALLGKGDLIISDSLNHSSIVTGARSSGAKVKVFRHGDMKHLEQIIRDAIAYGQPRKNRPWRKIMIFVEGIYSMEGDIVELDQIVALKKKYKCYLYVDEAHSIGAIGKSGRGVTEYWGVDPADVDILMGTFTKSFGSVGGYIAADKSVIDFLRASSWGANYATSLAPVCAQQIISAMGIIMDEVKGKERLRRLSENSKYLRSELKKRGFVVIGDDDSPVVPLMLYGPSRTIAFSRMCLENNLAAVVVGFPATPLYESRARFCLSAAHTLEELKEAVNTIDKVGDFVMVKFNKNKAVTL